MRHFLFSYIFLLVHDLVVQAWKAGPYTHSLWICAVKAGFHCGLVLTYNLKEDKK